MKVMLFSAVLAFMAVSLVLISGSTQADTVTNTNDSGPGSLRQAITDANNQTGANTIAFNIPTSDPGYNPSTGVWTIQPSSALPQLTDDGTTIDGTTQTANQGDTNSSGPEIEINGANANGTGFWINGSANNIIRGLVINRFSGSGVRIDGADATGNTIVSNYIGTDVTGTVVLGNDDGIVLGSGTKSNIIGGLSAGEGNLISGNNNNGVDIFLSDNNYISGNYIGTGVSDTEDLGNTRDGVSILSAKGNIIGPDNLITNNGGMGIVVEGGDATGNTITQNSITGNNGLGINNIEGGNIDLTPPTITTVSYTFISGIAPSNSTVEIFSDPEDEGKSYEGNTNADGDGNFSWTGSLTGPNATATATDQDGNTSEFSADIVVPVELVNFFASCYHGTVILEWTTATESNNYGFEVERSLELKAHNEEQKAGNRYWERIGFVPGHGTTTSPYSYNFTDRDVTPSMYYYRLKQIDRDGSFEYSSDIAVKVEIPKICALEQNYPNPFNPETTIRFVVAKSNRVILKVFSVLGREVKILIDENYQPGYYRVNFNASDLADGIYFYSIQIGDFTNTKKMLLIR